MSALRKIGVVLGLLDDPDPVQPAEPLGASYNPPDEIWRALYYLKDPIRPDDLFDLFFYDSYFESRVKFWRWLRSSRQSEEAMPTVFRVEIIRLDARVGDRWVRYEVDETADRLVLAS